MVAVMPRLAVKLLLLDHDERLLLIRARDQVDQTECWYAVGGGVEPGESLQVAAEREAYEETGIRSLPTGHPVWRRDHTYTFNGRTMAVHEEWLLHRVDNFEPEPAELTDHESEMIIGYRWWNLSDLVTTTATVFPPHLGAMTQALLIDGLPSEPIDITSGDQPRSSTDRDSKTG